MTQPKQTALTNWLLGLATIAATGSMGFAWNTNMKIAVLGERDREKTEQINMLNQRFDNIQKVNYDLIMRVSSLENKSK